MRKGILLLACLAAMVLIASAFYAARVVLTRSFSSIEADEARLSIERVRQALEVESRQLEMATADYGAWDSTYEFVQGRNPDYVRKNLAGDALRNVGVSLVWIADSQGRTVVQLATGGSAPGGLRPLPPEAVARLQLLLPAAGKAASRRSVLLRLPRGVFALAAAPVLRSDWTGPSDGTIVFGRLLDSSLVSRLEQTSQLPVAITLLDASGRPMSPVSGPLRAWLASGGRPDLLVQAGDSTTLGSSLLLRDSAGRPLLVLSTKLTRAALQVAKRAITWVFAALLACFALLLVLWVTMLNRYWRSRSLAQEQLLEHKRKMARLAGRDPLTGLPNRLYLQRLLPRLLRRAERTGSRPALLYLDLDHFKQVNDSLGHSSGDRLLSIIAQRLRAAVDSRDLVVRMGGDEFVVVIARPPSSAVIDSIAARVRTALAAPLELDGVSLSVTPSIGIAVYPEGGSDLEQLLKHADIALYHAKESGRSNHQLYSPQLQMRLQERPRTLALPEVETEESARMAAG